jgi:hypothetical protein
MGYPTSLESDFYSNPPGRYGFLSMKILIFPHNPRVYIAGASGDRETIPSVFSLGVHRLFGGIFVDFSYLLLWRY